MTTQTSFSQIRIGGLFFQDQNPNALPLIKIENSKARTPSGAVVEFNSDALVYATTVTVRLAV